MAITLTNAAVEKVKGLMVSQNRADALLRVFVQGGGCRSGYKFGMAFDDTVEETDQVYDFSGLRVLIDEASGPYLDGASIDYMDTVEGAGFAISNPNIDTSCGCGGECDCGGSEESDSEGCGCGCGCS
ncbi:MAG: iron-sulfur cluster assembly accessory protein [Armatimonadetes bacterium]|nr:iron-sulfur cluster assembly accessory protein [Armatimonadota bacterium]